SRGELGSDGERLHDGAGQGPTVESHLAKVLAGRLRPERVAGAEGNPLAAEPSGHTCDRNRIRSERLAIGSRKQHHHGTAVGPDEAFAINPGPRDTHRIPPRVAGAAWISRAVSLVKVGAEADRIPAGDAVPATAQP